MTDCQQLFDWLTDWLTDWVIEWLTALLTNWLTFIPTHWLIDWRTGSITDWTDWLSLYYNTTYDRFKTWSTSYIVTVLWLTHTVWSTDQLIDRLFDWLIDLVTG